MEGPTVPLPGETPEPTTQGPSVTVVADVAHPPTVDGPQGPGRRRWWASPWFVLLLASPVIGEVLSGSSPPLEFINPVGFFLMVGLYGCGAILVREAVVRWRKGWPTLLALGMAYGVLEEGVMVKSWINPEWMDLGEMAWYGRWGGVNWVWAEMLTMYHAAVSIMLAVLLVELLFPRIRGRSIIAGRVARGVWSWFLVVVAIGVVGFPPFPAPLVPWLLTIVITAGLVLLGRWLPPSLGLPRRRAVPSPSTFLTVGVAWSTTFFVGFWTAPYWGVHAALAMLVMALQTVAFALLVLWMSGEGLAWKDRHRMALGAGALGFMVFLDFVLGLGNPASLMWAVGIADVLALTWMWRRVVRSEGAAAAQPAAHGPSGNSAA
jgi:hypothetical protein